MPPSPVTEHPPVSPVAPLLQGGCVSAAPQDSMSASNSSWQQQQQNWEQRRASFSSAQRMLADSRCHCTTGMLAHYIDSVYNIDSVCSSNSSSSSRYRRRGVHSGAQSRLLQQMGALQQGVPGGCVRLHAVPHHAVHQHHGMLHICGLQAAASGRLQADTEAEAEPACLTVLCS